LKTSFHIVIASFLFFALAAGLPTFGGQAGDEALALFLNQSSQQPSGGSSSPEVDNEVRQNMLQQAELFVEDYKLILKEGNVNDYFRQINASVANQEITLDLYHIEERGCISGESANQIADSMYAYYKTKSISRPSVNNSSTTIPFVAASDERNAPERVAPQNQYESEQGTPPGPPDNTPVQPLEFTGNEAAQVQAVENKQPVAIEPSDSAVDQLPHNVQVLKLDTDTPAIPPVNSDNKTVNALNQPQSVVQDEEDLQPPKSELDTPSGQIPAALQTANADADNAGKPEIPDAIASESKKVPSNEINELLDPKLSEVNDSNQGETDAKEPTSDSQMAQDDLTKNKTLNVLIKASGVSIDESENKQIDTGLAFVKTYAGLLSQPANTLADYNEDQLDTASKQAEILQKNGPIAEAAAVKNEFVEDVGAAALQTATPRQVDVSENADIIKDAVGEGVEGAQKIAELKDSLKGQGQPSQGLTPTSTTGDAQTQQAQKIPDALTNFGTKWESYGDGSYKNLSTGTYFVRYAGYYWQSNSDGTRVNSTLGITVLPDGTVVTSKAPAPVANQGVNAQQ